MAKQIQKQIDEFPTTPGVYIFKNKDGGVIYIGKAANLKRRVRSYFNARDIKSKKITEEAKSAEFKETETVIEALIKEAELIKLYRPIFNIKEKDDRSFLHVVITKEEYPRVLLVRGKDLEKQNVRSFFGPFVFSSEIRNALKIVRKIFPYSTHTEKEIKKGEPCFYYQIDLCPGTCVGEIGKREYLKNIKNIEMFFKGKKKKIISKLKKEMKEAGNRLEFEKAEELKKKIKALMFIQDTALMAGRKSSEKSDKPRIEGYDISNISGDLAVGAMVVFKGSSLQKKEYRLFKIRSVRGPNDTEMLKEVIERRMKNDWPLPALIVVDGGKGQVNAVKKALEKEGLLIPVVGIAKGEDRKGESVVGKNPLGVGKETLLKTQREAHRFAINYHRSLRKKSFL